VSAARRGAFTKVGRDRSGRQLYRRGVDEGSVGRAVALVRRCADLIAAIRAVRAEVGRVGDRNPDLHLEAVRAALDAALRRVRAGRTVPSP